MLLTPSGAARYLLHRGYLRPEFIVDSGVQISEAVKRNRGFRVTWSGERGYWVKQIREWNEAGIASFRREARWYWLVRNDPRFSRFAGIVPVCLAYDAAAEILVLELAPEASDLSQGDARFSLDVAANLGRTLASFHRDSQEAGAAAGFASVAPWVYSLPEFRQDPDPEWSQAKREVLRIIDAYPGFKPSLEALQAEWSQTALIHGDMKFDNCIGGGDRLRIIDWEMTGLGDPCWDSAGILQAYWFDWITEAAPLGTIRGAAREFWTHYVDALAPNGDRTELLFRTVRFAAARLIQTVWEDRRDSERLSHPTLQMLQLSLNAFADPPAAASSLVGL
jgi:hypothetical protein